jgi:hypothetical protein
VQTNRLSDEELKELCMKLAARSISSEHVDVARLARMVGKNRLNWRLWDRPSMLIEVLGMFK